MPERAGRDGRSRGCARGAATLALLLIPFTASCDRTQEPAPDPCSERIVVLMRDARPLELVARRCEAAPGRAPALLVATHDVALARDWRDALPSWASSGRATWLAVLEEGGATLRDDLELLTEELAAQSGIDEGRVALLVSERLAAAAGLDAGSLAAARAVVVHAPGEAGASRRADSRLVVRGAPSALAGEVDAFLAESLAVRAPSAAAE